MGFYDLGFKFLGSQGLRVEAHLLVLEEGHNPSVRLEESVCGDSGRSAGDEDAVVGWGGGEGGVESGVGHHWKKGNRVLEGWD